MHNLSRLLKFQANMLDRHELDQPNSIHFDAVCLRNSPNEVVTQLTTNKDRVEPYSHSDGCRHIRVVIIDAAASKLALSAKGPPARSGEGIEAPNRGARASSSSGIPTTTTWKCSSAMAIANREQLLLSSRRAVAHRRFAQPQHRR
jgi:hypothetical protein